MHGEADAFIHSADGWITSEVVMVDGIEALSCVKARIRRAGGTARVYAVWLYSFWKINVSGALEA
jgi:hypothetical protein